VSARLFVIGLILFGALGFNVFLLADEEILPADAKTKAETRQQDILYGMQHTVAQREGNFVKMGFEPDEVKELLKRVNTLEEKYRVKEPTFNLVSVRIEGTDDEDALAAAFCRTGSTLPVRYSAMPFLLEQRDGKLKTVDLQEISSFQYGEWGKAARIQAAYEEGDLTKDRKEDAPRMVMAAILAADEATLIEHASPWGGGFLGGGWSWKAVQEKHRGVKTLLIDYVASLHLVLETASAEGGLCST
jgi:hypothetical protein